MPPAGMEPLGSERHGQSPQGRSAGALRSIEPSCGTTTKLPTIWHIAECPRRESNPHLRFRKPPFYPLNYGGEVAARFSDADWRLHIKNLLSHSVSTGKRFSLL